MSFLRPITRGGKEVNTMAYVSYQDSLRQGIDAMTRSYVVLVLLILNWRLESLFS